MNQLKSAAKKNRRVFRRWFVAWNKGVETAGKEAKFFETIATCGVTILVQEPWQGSVRFKTLARFEAADATDLYSNPMKWLLDHFGGGKFKLSAKKDDGTTIEDEGTMEALRKKYEFLRSAFAMRMPLTLDGPAGWPSGTEARFMLSPRAGVVGVLVRPASEELRHHLALPTGSGLVVHQVTPGSLADRIGLKRFDIVMRLDDELIDSPRQLKKLTDSKGVLEIIRRAKPTKIDLAKVPAPKSSEKRLGIGK